MRTYSIEVIIPAYNEAATIAPVIKAVKDTLGAAPRIIVVDDASQDQTAAIAAASGAEVISHPYRMGNGASIKTGLRNARSEVVVFMDGDGQHQPADIPLLIAGLDRFDMAVGARNLSGWSLRNLANRIYNGLASYITQFKIKDLTSGFRCLRKEAAMKFMYLFPNGFSYPTTLTLAFLKTGRTIAYVPLSFKVRRQGKSKIHLVEDGIKFLLIIIRLATFFSPLRVFVPVSIFFFLSGLGYYMYTYTAYHRFTNMSALLFTTSLIIFMLGLVSEQISQLRMDRTEQ